MELNNQDELNHTNPEELNPEVETELHIPKNLTIVSGAVYAGVIRYVKNTYISEESFRKSLSAIKSAMMGLQSQLSPIVLAKTGITESRIKESFLVELSAARLSLPGVEDKGYQRTYDAVDIAVDELGVDKGMLENPNIAFKGYRLSSILNKSPKKLIASLALGASLFAGTVFTDKAEAAIELSDLGRIALRAVAENINVDYNSDKSSFSVNIEGEDIKDRLGNYAASAAANALFKSVVSLPDKIHENKEAVLNSWAKESISEISELKESDQFTYLRLLYIGKQLHGFSSIPALVTCAYAVNPTISDTSLNKICTMVYKNCKDTDRESITPSEDSYKGAYQLLAKYFPEFDKNDEMIRLTGNLSVITMKLHKKQNSKALEAAKTLVDKSISAISRYYDAPALTAQIELLKAAYVGKDIKQVVDKDSVNKVKEEIKDSIKDNDSAMAISLEIS